MIPLSCIGYVVWGLAVVTAFPPDLQRLQNPTTCLQARLLFNADHSEGVHMPPWVLDLQNAHGGLFFQDARGNSCDEVLTFGIDQGRSCWMALQFAHKSKNIRGL